MNIHRHCSPWSTRLQRMKMKVVLDGKVYGPKVMRDAERSEGRWQVYLVRYTFYCVVCVYMFWSAREIAVLRQEVHKRSGGYAPCPEVAKAGEHQAVSDKNADVPVTWDDITKWWDDVTIDGEVKDVRNSHRVERSAPTTAKPNVKRKRKSGRRRKCKCRGLRGFRGWKGLPGTNGTDGKQGRPGHPGKRGSEGTNGYPGEPGPQGLIGLPGTAGPRGPPGQPGLPGIQGEKGDSGTLEKIMAAHFTSTIPSRNRHKQFSARPGCETLWGGDYCQSRKSFHSKRFDHVMQFLSTQSLINAVTSPIVRQLDGRFQVKYSGLYLLYINVQAISNEWNNEVSVLIGGSKNRQLPCIVSTTDKHDSTYSLAPTKSCSAVSAFFIQKDTYLSVVISEPDKAVALTNGTNFGAVLLSRG